VQSKRAVLTSKKNKKIKNMIEVNPSNVNDYFEEEIVDEIFDYLNFEINRFISISPNIGIGCSCLSDVNIKKLGKRNVYVEYNYEILGSRNKIPVPIKVEPHKIIIYEGNPIAIQEKINKIKEITTNYSKLN
jgi:hypothetical protein